MVVSTVPSLRSVCHSGSFAGSFFGYGNRVVPTNTPISVVDIVKCTLDATLSIPSQTKKFDRLIFACAQF